jgi:hypothetical protein
VRNLRRIGGLGRGGSAGGSSFLPLIAISLVGALLLTQKSVTVAYPLFQSPLFESPIQSPTATSRPPAGSPVPSVESPVIAPSETASVPAGATPEASPAVEPGQTPGATRRPQATPSARMPEEGGTAEPPSGEESAAPVSRDSLAVVIDALVVGLSTLWLCCGGVALVVFFLLVVASFLLRVT